MNYIVVNATSIGLYTSTSKAIAAVIKKGDIAWFDVEADKSPNFVSYTKKEDLARLLRNGYTVRVGFKTKPHCPTPSKVQITMISDNTCVEIKNAS